MIAEFRASLKLLPEPDGLMETWLRLVRERAVAGRAAHDARLAAFAIGHGIGTVATRDQGGFARFGLEEIEP